MTDMHAVLRFLEVRWRNLFRLDRLVEDAGDAEVVLGVGQQTEIVRGEAGGFAQGMNRGQAAERQ